DASGAVQGSDPEPGPEKTAPEEQAWTKEVSFSRKPEPEPEPVAASPAEQIAAEAPTETWSATPVLPPQPEPVVVHPPVPAAELPPQQPEKVPFWKKELSFGGREEGADEPDPETR